MEKMICIYICYAILLYTFGFRIKLLIIINVSSTIIINNNQIELRNFSSLVSLLVHHRFAITENLVKGFSKHTETFFLDGSKAYLTILFS